MELLTKTQKAKEDFADNQFHNILRLFDVLPKFPFTTSETMRDYYLLTWYIRVASQVAEWLKTLGNYPHGIFATGGALPTREEKALGN